MKACAQLATPVVNTKPVHVEEVVRRHAPEGRRLRHAVHAATNLHGQAKGGCCGAVGGGSVGTWVGALEGDKRMRPKGRVHVRVWM